MVDIKFRSLPYWAKWVAQEKGKWYAFENKPNMMGSETSWWLVEGGRHEEIFPLIQSTLHEVVRDTNKVKQIFITEQERLRLVEAMMIPMGTREEERDSRKVEIGRYYDSRGKENPYAVLADLVRKYGVPETSTLNWETGEFQWGL